MTTSTRRVQEPCGGAFAYWSAPQGATTSRQACLATEATKRKNKEESTTTPQEPIMILEESYRIEDDGHETLDTKLRQRLRPINADPKVWWVKGAFNRVESPVLGASLYTEHLMPGMVAEKTILMSHDRGAHIELKNYLTKNSNVFSESKKKLKITDDQLKEVGIAIVLTAINSPVASSIAK